MKTIIILFLVSALIFFSCNQTTSEQKKNAGPVESLQNTLNKQEVSRVKEKEELQNLIRQTLKWADSPDVINLIPMLANSEKSAYIGIDFTWHRSNLEKLRSTGLFTNEFIENYNQIILTLDKKIRNQEYQEYEWFVGDLPPFRFAGGTNPWCACQDVPYDDPSPWDYVEIEIIELNDDKAQLFWKWGGIDLYTDSGWNESIYTFRAAKENDKWKIAYLQEFDFEESTR